MTSTRQPTFFITHGAGPCFWMDFPALGSGAFDGLRAYFAGLLASLPQKPDAILVMSAHWETEGFAVSAAAHPGMIYDYSGFPEHTYRLSHPAPGAPALAQSVRELLTAAGLQTDLDPARGFDHGVFVPMMIVNPLADIPIVTLSVARKILRTVPEPVSPETLVHSENHASDATPHALSSLTPREKHVLQARFGFNTDTDHTPEEIGRQFSVTRERIRQIEAKALQKLQRAFDPATHYAAGAALAPLRDANILVIGSGSSYHNLRDFFAGSAEAADAFDGWLDETMALPDITQRQARLTQWESAPGGQASHPRAEHLIPLLTVAGAGGTDKARRDFHAHIGNKPFACFRFG